ncbi:citrate synthase-lysine N-methyltransferase CSKMT, mitochondrial [Spea bombifrons]|uniref:citrate synthase-lysine N-methyltransferase CSKMT, mitochondrial n=1 Tax=Spea bombifrons TaxID=233779 RepID=UPI00234BE32D|nr:citrate synthase-lysine N-methyltransferase CSKMT, mitochondrial [Spea bombifrons]
MAFFRRLLLSSLRYCTTQKFGTEAGTGEMGETLRNCMGDRATWDAFYSQSSPDNSSHFDWFFSYNFLQDFLLSLLSNLAQESYAGHPLHILDVGCGISDLGLCLFRDSPISVLVSCIDRCEPAILTMRNRITHGHSVISRHPDSCLQYIQGDVTDLYWIPSASVSLVLDKGTSDSLMRSGMLEATNMVKEALRVLRPGGKLVQLTDEDPDVRLPFLEKAGAGPFTILHKLMNKDGMFYYAYITTPPQT